MLAWDRVARAFDRTGGNLSDISPATAEEVKKAVKRAQTRQGRPPGDFALNRKADEVVEAFLQRLGYSEEIERGYREFVENERKRYAAALAGRDGKEMKKIIEVLPKRPGESPLDAARRIVDERKRIGGLLGVVSDESKPQDLASKFKAAPDESLLSAARRVAANARLVDSAVEMIKDEKMKSERLESQLTETQGRVVALEKEIAPLRKLKEVVVRFLEHLTEWPVLAKLGSKFETILRELGNLVGIEFAKKNAKPAPSPTNDMP